VLRAERGQGAIRAEQVGGRALNHFRIAERL